MPQIRKAVSTTMASILFVLVSFAAGLLAADITITGEVDDQFQILATDGDIYAIADTDKGMELANEHINEMVEIVGTIEYSEEDDMKIVTVEKFKVISPGIADEE